MEVWAAWAACNRAGFFRTDHASPLCPGGTRLRCFAGCGQQPHCDGIWDERAFTVSIMILLLIRPPGRARANKITSKKVRACGSAGSLRLGSVRISQTRTVTGAGANPALLSSRSQEGAGTPCPGASQNSPRWGQAGGGHDLKWGSHDRERFESLFEHDEHCAAECSQRAAQPSG
jgi:hypothetical protein